MNRIQNHKEGGIGSIYDRHRYSARKTKDHGGSGCGYYGAQPERGSQARAAVRLMSKRALLERIWLTSSLHYRRR
jgi:hypothetical protein